MKVVLVSLMMTVCLLVSAHRSDAQRAATENIVIVTLDGMRWQEMFKGVDDDIASNRKYVVDEVLVSRFRRDAAVESRQVLMPFVWNMIGNQGQLYGNREYENEVDCKNRHLFSYPGYSEMLIGFPDLRVSSNRPLKNAHPTVLEAIANDFRFSDEVAAFATWDAFNHILREKESKIHVNAGADLAQGQLSAAEASLNELLRGGHRRTDSITFQYAMAYLNRVRPRVVFIGLDAMDHYAHKGRYDKYLNAAYEADRMLNTLWNWLQSQPDYQGTTTLLVTTDHGRGNGKHNWRKHGRLTPGSRHIWFAVMGPDTPAFGEMKSQSVTYQNQVARTIAAFLGLNYENKGPVGDVVQTMIALPTEETVLSVFGE